MPAANSFRITESRIPEVRITDGSMTTSTSRWSSIEGTPFPLGATWLPDEKAFNFALYSKHARRVTLRFFGDDLSAWLYSVEFDPMGNRSDSVWHCRVPFDAVRQARFYAYQIEGPVPVPGFDIHEFDYEKLLLDPYAHDVHFPPAFDREAARGPGSNIGRAPLSVLQPSGCGEIWKNDPLVRHESDLIVYELHVRGFTVDPSSQVDEARRGTFAGVIDKIPYLKELGVTAVELMPVFQFDPQEGNYWGYMPLNFFSPHNGYCEEPATCEQHLEFASMVNALHKADIEVWIDVVYNHTCEGNEHGPTYCYKGIDNSTYYMTTGDPRHPYANYSGTGNTLHTVNRATRQLIVDSLRYWVTELHVDGFRFDLASIFTRNSDGSINTGDPAIFGQIAGDPHLQNTRLVAEPWDAAGAYHLGRSFPGLRWKQWNAAYRDALQKFVRGDGGMIPELMTRLYGSDDLFPDDPEHALRPFQSINYVCSHDGFTMYDLVSYSYKRNWANGHNNVDGHVDYSWNCGWEGDDGLPPHVRELRKRQVKNFCCLLMLSNGIPMLRMGDEFLNTQHGNSNPYNQDNETSWLDWSALETNADVFRYFKEMIAFRKRHPSLCRSRFWREDVHWHGVDRNPDLSWHSRACAFYLGGASQHDADIYAMINAWWEPLEFGIHESSAGDWKRVVDTARDSPDDIVDEADAPTVSATTYRVGGRSVVVLVRG